MNALRHWVSFEAAAGPMILHSTWWLRAHWGRAFEILEIDEAPVGLGLSNHRWLAMRKRDVTLTVADLERPEPDEQLSRLHQGGKPVFSRQEIRRALGDDDASA
jgi:hypothetical protein